jgi:rRNA maturation endonuclease Nob1
MSVPLSSSSLGASSVNGSAWNYRVSQTNPQTAKSQFQQLGHDLQVGNLTQARQDYNALTQGLTGHRISSGLAQDFKALGQALNSGNLPAARQAYSVIQQALQQLGLSLAGSNLGQPTGNIVNATA